MRAFYLKYILHPLFMFAVKHVPLFVDYCVEYVRQLNRRVHGKLLDGDFFDKAREAISNVDV